MTGLVEMASMSQWKQNVSDNRKIFNDSPELRLSSASGERFDNSEIHIPAWRRNVHAPQPDRLNKRDSSTGNSVHAGKNLHQTQDSNDDNVVKFELGGCEDSDMGIDKELNSGGRPTTSYRDLLNIKSVDNTHLKHVHSNPFFQELGVTHQHGRILSEDFDGSLPESDSNSQLSRTGSILSTGTTDDDQEEYGPHSGIVEKLRKKFANLSTKTGFKGSQSSIKRYGSLDNLLGLDKSTAVKEQAPVPKYKPVDKNIVKSSHKPKLKGKPAPGIPGSQTVSHTKSKPPLSIQNESYKPRPASVSSIEAQKSPIVQSSVQTPSIENIYAEDIIIIEQSKKPTISRKMADENNKKAIDVKEETKGGNDMPKPNTVSSVRTLFESNYKKNPNRMKLLPDAPRTPKFVGGAAPLANKTKKLHPPKSVVNQSEAGRGSVSSDISSEPSSPTSVFITPPVSPAVVTSAPNLSTSSITKTSVSDSTTPSLVAESTAIKSQKIPADIVTNKEIRTDIKTELPNRPPKAFDSPVTKKKNIGEMKSIFDSQAITPKPVAPVIKPKRNNQVPRKPDIAVANNKPVSLIPNGEVVVTEKEVVIINDVTVAQKPKTKVEEKPQTTASSTSKGDDLFPGRKQIFDSSAMFTNDTTPKIIVQKPPPRPRAIARKEKLSSSNSIENDSSIEKDVKRVSPVPVSSLPSNESVTKPSKFSTPNGASNPRLGGNVITSSGKDLISSSTPQKPADNDSNVSPSVSSTPRISNSFDTRPSTPWVKSQKTSAPSAAPVLKQEPVNSKSNAEKSDSSVTVSNFEPVHDKSDQQNGDLDLPTKGIPSIIAKRLHKDKQVVNGDATQNNNVINDDAESEEEDVVHSLVKPSDLLKVNSKITSLRSGPVSSPVPKKRVQKHSADSEVLHAINKNKTDSNSQKNASVPQTNIDDLIRGRKSSPKALFDSSTIVANAPSANGVPPLDLSLIEEKRNHPYQEGYIPTKIEPCKIVFLGAEVKLAKNPLKKTRKAKVRIFKTQNEILFSTPYCLYPI